MPGPRARTVELPVTRVVAGRYELEVPLGSGAFGEVWRGTDLAARRPVAVKLIQLARVDNDATVAETIGRFRREADALARLRHPNIVAGLDAGRLGSELFLVMELAEGMSMAGMLAQRHASGFGLFPVDTVLRIAKQACAGLAAAHAAGIVHRDIKPGNLMVSARGHVTIVDFGIAKLMEDNSPRLTAPSTALGTVTYMSPEQAMGRDLDGRADLYSFGCVLYEMLAGRPPFLADDPAAQMMMQVRDQARPVEAIRSGLPAGLPELVGQLLDKDRDARPPDAGQVVRSLVAISERAGAPAIPEHEADRRTCLPGDEAPAGADRQTASAGDAAPGKADRQTVTDPRTGAGFGSGGFGTGGGFAAGSGLAAGAGAPDLASSATVSAGPPRLGSRKPAAPGRAGVPGGPGPARGKPGSGTGGAAKAAWPAAPAARRRRRRRWTSVVSTLITMAIVAGAGLYLWQKAHGSLKVTAVTVAVPQPPGTRCDVVVDVTGTIFTNGHGGPITYQWTHDKENLPVATVTDGSGQQSVRVDLRWQFHGAGTRQAVATLRVFAPNVVAAQSAGFTYACPS